LNHEQSPDSKFLILFKLKCIRTNKVWNLRGCTADAFLSDTRAYGTCWFARNIGRVIISRPIIRCRHTYWVHKPAWNTWLLARSLPSWPEDLGQHDSSTH